MKHLSIRKYVPSDNKQIRALYELSSVHSEIGYRSGPWEHDFAIIESYYAGGIFLVGMINEQIVTMGGIQKITPEIAHIRRMRTHPKERRKGYASKLLRELEKNALTNHLHTLRLRTSTQQKIAQHFYEQHGFREVYLGKTYYVEGSEKEFEVIWYEKQLSKEKVPSSNR